MERWNEPRAGHSTGRPMILAHRGDWRGAPESSVAAIRAAIELPFLSGVEVDVRWSGDGVAILLHDESLERTHGIARLAREMTAAELGELGIATLDDALEILPGAATLILDLKEPPRPALYDSLFHARRQPADDRTIIEAFEHEIHLVARELAPAWPRWLNLRPPGYEIDEMVADALRLGCRGLCANKSIVTKPLVDAARKQNLSVAAWTVLDADDLARLAKMGVAVVFIEGPILQDERLDLAAGWLGID